MKNTTFLIVYSRDSNDRIENLNAVTRWLGNLNTNIVTREIPRDKPFHRTKAFNDLARAVGTPVIVLCDSDCIIDPPINLILASQKIFTGKADFVWPFDSPNHSVLRSVHEEFLAGRRDLPEIKPIGSATPSGGMVFCSSESYWKSGGENENLIAYSPDDLERRMRWQKLGFELASIPGKIYHLDHWVGPNSSHKNPHFQSNWEEYRKEMKMTREELEAYIRTWGWAK